MKYIVTISRILLGLIFVVFGLNGFLHFIPTPQFPGVAGQFIGAIFVSHFYIVVFLTQIVGGLLLLTNRYVPLGLLLLGPVIVNILSFHIFMSTTNLPVALVATALWLIMFFAGRWLNLDSAQDPRASISRCGTVCGNSRSRPMLPLEMKTSTLDQVHASLGNRRK